MAGRAGNEIDAPSPVAFCALFLRDLVRRTGLVEINIPIFFDDIEFVESFVLAGAVYAKTAIGLEQGAMAGTDKMFLVMAKKLIGEYFQRNKLMWAGIDIGVMLVVFSDHDYVEPVRAFAKDDSLRARLGGLFCAAEVNHAFTPPMAQMRFHSGAVTG